MDVVLLNKANSKLIQHVESTYLRAFLLIGDSVYYHCPSSVFLYDYEERDKWKNENILIYYKVFDLENVFRTPIEQIEKAIEVMKQANSLKHKTKESIRVYQMGKKMMDLLKLTAIEFFEEMFKGNFLMEIIPFIKDKVFYANHSVEYFDDDRNRELLMEILEEAIMKDNNLQVFIDELDELMSAVVLEKGIIPEKAKLRGVDFLSAEILSFPKIHELTYKQMNYTRENLKEKLITLKVGIEELQKLLKTVMFSRNNFERIAEDYKQKIEPLLDPIQRAVNDELYIQQAKQRHGEDVNMRYYLGMTSASNMIRYYEKAGIFTKELSAKVCRHLKAKMNMEQTCLFVYGKVSS